MANRLALTKMALSLHRRFTVKTITTLFLLPLFLLGCQTDEPFDAPFEDRDAFIQSVFGQTYTSEWKLDNPHRPMAINLHNDGIYPEDGTLLFHLDVGREGGRRHERVWGRIDLDKLTQKGQRVHAPFTGEVDFFPYSLQSLHFLRESDGQYTLEKIVVGELSQFWPKPIIHPINFAELATFGPTGINLGLPNLDRIP